ncbi:MAG: hypothetical protein Q7J25_05860 [Vicinamibacterales bacterium]|nr:hypothetical protein [Vicinamibacterales bacterium]
MNTQMRDNGAAFRGAGRGIAVLLVVFTAVTFYLNLQINDSLSDDHAGYLAMARQIGFGELPIRDFVDLGTFLHLWLSAAVAKAGNFLLPELLMSWTFIAAGQAMAVYLVWRSTGSLVAAALAGVSAMLMFPRPYAFPKVFVYPLSVWLLWRYVEAPGHARLWCLGLWAAVALLLRFDHGTAVFGTAVGTILLTRGPHSVRQAALDLGELTAAFVISLGPFLVYLASTVGVLTHFGTMFAFGLYGLDESERFRWHSFLGTPWLAGKLGTAFLFDLIVLLIAGSALWAATRLVRDYRARRRVSVPTLQLCAVVGLCLTGAPMLVRNNFEARIPDAVSLLVIVAALAAVPWRTVGTVPGPAWRTLHRAAALTLAFLVLVAIMRGGVASGLGSVNLARLFSPDGFERAEGIIEDLMVSPPLEAYADPGIHGRGGLERYLRDCTRPDDRVLVSYFNPLLYIYSERGFAGGQWRYFRFHNSPGEQQATMRKLAQEHVPVAIVRRSSWESFHAEWEPLARHIESKYRRLEAYHPEGDDIEVWVDANRSQTGSLDGNVPCFR